MEHKRLSVSAGFCLMLALMLLLLPLRWLVAAVLAATVHELCHYLAIRLLCSGDVMIGFYSYSARMNLPEMSRGRELLCALAGPAGGLLLILLAPVFPRLAVCGFVQSVYNLLPVYPLDGGRAIACLLSMFLQPDKKERIVKWIGMLTRTAVVVAGCYCCLCLNLGFFPLILALLVCIRAK